MNKGTAVRIAGTDIYGRVQDSQTLDGTVLHKVDGAWFAEWKVLPQGDDCFVIGDRIMHGGQYAVVRFIFEYADGLVLLDTNRGTFNARDCVRA